MTKSLTMKRNPFFLPSGFEPQEIINIIEATGDEKKRVNKIKGRKKAERKLHKQGKICNKCKPSKKSTKTFRIQPGSKFAKETGVILPYIKNGFKHFATVKVISVDTDQIQRGYDLATKWGWDGINRPYIPKIISVFGGRKRRKG